MVSVLGSGLKIYWVQKSHIWAEIDRMRVSKNQAANLWACPKKLEFQLALETSSSQILLAMSKSFVSRFCIQTCGLATKNLNSSLPLGQVALKFCLP